jgi:hypothetical protein
MYAIEKVNELLWLVLSFSGITDLERESIGFT